MAHEQDRDALAEVLIENRSRGHQISAYIFDPWAMADAILASDWLAEHARRVAAAALREAADRLGHIHQADSVGATLCIRWLRAEADRVDAAGAGGPS